MLDRKEAVVLIGIIEDYKEKLKSELSKEDYDILTSIIRQLQNRLEIKENLNF